MEARQRFWLVCNPERITFRPPTFIHQDYDAAEREAKRLAAESPGQVFHVLGSIMYAEKVDVTTHEFGEDMRLQDVPF
jgi:hypothetical protein